MRDFIGTGISETGPNKNVINILRVLVEDKNSTVYVPFNYAAERGDRSKDPRVHFPAKESGRPMQIMDIQGHKERFNFSVSCLVDVKVEYPVSADPDAPMELRDKKIWRTYSIVRDGELVVEAVVAKLSESAYNELRDAGDILFLNDVLVTESLLYDSSAVYTIKLSGLPIVSSNWARPNALNFHKMLRESARLSSKLTVIKKYLKENNVPTSEESSDIYTETVADYSSSNSSKTVECVTYTISERPGYTAPKYSSFSAEDYKTTNTQLKDMAFKCACIKWAIESAISHRRSPYEWSEAYQKMAGSSRYYQEAIVEIDGVSHLLERCVYEKKV